MDFRCIFLIVCLAVAAQGNYVKTLCVDDMSVKTVSTRQNEIECIKQLFPDVIAAGQTLKGEMMHCIDPVIEDVKEWYEKLTMAIGSDINDLMAFMEELNACNGNILCSIGLLKKIGEKLVYTYEKVAVMIDELIGSLEGDFPEVVKCALGALDAFGGTMNEIVDRFMECRA